LSVLIVDDNATDRRLLHDLLSQWQMKPTSVDSGAAALVALKQAEQNGQPFAMVLLDGMMPDMDGFTVASHIKQCPELAKVTLIMLSSAALGDNAERCRALGLDGYLTKPIVQADLWDEILKALRLSDE